MCNNKLCGCTVLAAISLVVGVIVAILVFTGAITAGLLIAPIIATAIVGIVIFGILLIISAINKPVVSKCICENGKCVAIGSAGMIVTSIISFLVTLEATSVVSAIFVGLIAFFSFLTLISTLFLIKCLIEANCRCRD